ncbi:uncharacterized protein LOC105428197 isoform X1 [Pogonomyrmex barbatus]|uniref:Uncharacterized protein LOC105428197 isoform X1 n=1 Tax=Pogonomyrmex barbatus TaxID=144034 RepID=A0A6I9W8Z3_9HYME|nr:uncharacterized protein LOC105428197 isoform X1 [Pogonomyrmex barbatus]XP_011638657.1 uncharacterized protein LOC105428197 isoform X1 [Pogonomyrmex barbatus]
MNYSGNMPDWHQYNPPQSGINDVTSTAQNVNSGHLPFISSISPTCPTQLNSLNLSSEGLEKHQNDSNFNPRHFQPHLSSNISHGHNAADNNPLASMVQMQNCIGHYGPSNTRNPMVDNLNGSMDPRNAAIGGINEELGYRNNQVPLNGPISHLNGPNVMNMNAPHAPIGPRNTNVNSHAAGRTGPPPSYVPCKGLCCNPDPNINYQQWEKYCSYQNNAAYRENIRSSTGYQTDARRYGNEYNFRKDNFDGKEILTPMVPPPNGLNADQRRNFPDFKYRKDRMLSRSYPSSSGMLQNYPVQNYNYTGEYQKYPYNVKEYSKMSGMNVPNQTMVKHPEQGFAMPQQKYNNKQVSYQAGGAMMPNSMPSTNASNPSMMPPAQNTYYNSQYPRNLPTDTSHDCQETADNASMVNRMQTSTMHTSPHSRYQMYQQKIAMQRFSMENHLRELTRIPGYQSHPKYKECVHRYREILKLQQSVTYQGQVQQSPPCVAASTVNTSAIPPINLQFDQNGVLINSNYMPEGFPRVQQPVNSQVVPVDSSVDKQIKQDGSGVPEMANRNVQKPEQVVSQQHDGHVTALCAESGQKQDQYPAQKSLDQNQFEVQKAGSETFNNLTVNAGDTAIQQKMSKEFADKPELDVRQFLANWDESEDEDGATASLPSAILSDSTPVVVVGYENVDLTGKTLEGLEVSKPEGIAPGVITFENQEKSNIGVVPAQDCLTISYSSAENVEIAKDAACKAIAKEGIVRSGGHIIQCISNGPDEVPTIHIVDNLEIGSILQVTNGQVTEALERQDAVSFFQEGTGAITIEADKFKKTDGDAAIEPAAAEYNADLSKKKYVVESSSPSKPAEVTSQMSRVSEQEIAVLPTPAKDNSDSGNTNLKKQSSFASEESHNPDDISLPDLPTSECTPISTTLNTPIHSDNEESSERVEDLTIPANPIEIIQNSPMISFTQSPTKGEPYDHLNSEGTVRNKSTDSLESEYQTENRFKNNDNDGNSNMLAHDTILGTFEFSANIDKNDATISAKNNKQCANLNGTSASVNSGEKVFALDDQTDTVGANSMRMTLTSGEYELKIVSTGMQNKSARDYKNSMNERRPNESQAVSPDVHKKLQTETSAMKADDILPNETNNYPVDGHDDVNYTGKKCVSTANCELTQTEATNMGSSLSNDAAFKISRPGDSSQIVRNNLAISHSTKHLALNNDKSRKGEVKEKNPSSEKNASDNRSMRIDAKDSRNVKLADHKRSVTSDQDISHRKRCLSENTTNICSETIVHHSKHTQETSVYKNKSCTVENSKGSDNSHNKPKVIENISIDDSGERMRLLKKYRKMKYKSFSVGEIHDKGKDKQETSHYAANKKYHSSSNSDERSMSQSCDKHLYQKETVKSKSPEEPEGKRANILKTFVTKNINPDFAIQVTNVNLKLKDNDHQKKESQHSGEEAKNSGSLDAIKIEINVSCTERNTTEKLLHENIKNAVAETIGHLTNSISNGARSNSTSITEIQCEHKADGRDYEKRNRSPPAVMDASTYNEAQEDHSKEDANSETADSLSKKRRSSLSERELINNVYETTGTFSNTRARSSSCDVILRGDILSGNIETELTSSALESSKSEHAAIRRRSGHQDTERKITATSEELKASSNNSSYLSSTSRNVSVQKKEHQEATAAYSCKGARNLQDDTASRLNAVPSTSSNSADPLKDTNYENTTHFDYDHFDVAPNDNTDIGDKRIDKWKRSKRDDGRFSNFDLYETASGYVNPTFFSADELENLNTIPVYTTKDGKITYSPNPRFTYRELIMEARAKDGHGNARESYLARSPSYDYYNCSKLRKVFKRNRDVTNASRKRDIDPVDAKPVAKHVDYLPNRNATHKSANCAKVRSTSHLEFFNDDADKLYINKNSQENKESNKKDIVDLDFLEKQYNLDNEPTSSVKHYKAKVFADDLEKAYSENFVFDSNLLLGPKTACWEETMESIKSYSSHIDRRNSNNMKELNFGEIFTAEKRLDSFPFLPVEQDSLDNSNCKNCDVTNEPLHCDYPDDLHSIRGEDLPCEQLDAISCNEQENGCNNRDDASADNDKPENMHNTSLNVQNENDEHTKNEESRFDESKFGAIELTERARSCSPKIADEKIHESENNECSTDYIKDKEPSTEHQVDNTDLHCAVSPKEDKSVAEVANIKEVSEEFVKENEDSVKENKDSVKENKDSVKESEDSIKVSSPSKSNVEFRDALDETKNTEAVKESTLPLDNEIDKSTKDDSDSIVIQESTYQQVSSPSIDCKDREEIAPAVESNISAEINFDQTIEQNIKCDRGNLAVSTENESIASQNHLDVVSTERTLDEEDKERLSEKGEDENAQKIEVSLKDQKNDEVVQHDSCPTMTSTPAAALDLRTEENVCDLFGNENHEQNISEFTVIKSIIKGDKQQCHEPEANRKNCDNISDSKLLCMDSSDCGIYVEDRCTLTQMSEHDFTEDDSMVPMVWETSQIQEDAVNRLCSIDESLIDFTCAVNSLQDNSLLDHLSLSRMSSIKEPRAVGETTEIESKMIDEPIIESVTTIEESKTTQSNDENKERNQISSSSYEKVAYLRATDCNANTKLVPKLVIKKSETSSKFITKMSSSSVMQEVITANKSVCQPKIPKMIIRNARSRPSTPSIESVREEIPAIPQTNISDRTLFLNEESCESNSECSLQELSYRNKIPKMKIKLDEKHSSKIVRADEDDEEICVKRKSVKKTIPKVKIKSTLRSDLANNSVCNSMISQESRDFGRYEEKIPVLKLKKQERNRSSSPEVTRKRQSSSYSEVPIKKYKRSGRDATDHSTKRSSSSDSTARTNAQDYETKKDFLMRISEKIPKVIIKRTSASAEFKCELSKSCKKIIAKSAKWQPEVKLERYQILDSMVKDLKLTLSPVTLRAIDKMSANHKDDHCREKQSDYKLSRSNSTSDLFPAKCKQRRMSDYDCRKVGDAKINVNFAPSQDADSKECTTPKKIASSRSHKSAGECRKDNKRRSRSRDNNPRVEADVPSSDKEINHSSERANSQKSNSECDKHKTDNPDINREQATKTGEDTILNKLDQQNVLAKHSSSSNFKLTLKELKTTSKIENCFEKSSGPSEMSSEEVNLQSDQEQTKERDDDSFSNKVDSKIIIKKERPNVSSDMHDDCTLQDCSDIDLLKDDSTSMELDNFEMATSTVIKVESSEDESQSTIEILPALPDNDHSELERHVEDGDSEQLYSADAIPTQFELELEITDNSNTDLLDVPMPKLDPITSYNSRHAIIEESGNQIAKVGCYNKSEASSYSKNSPGKDKRVVDIDISGNRSALEDDLAGSVREISSKASCCKAAGFATRENFCCNDSLIKEVLAAKETLKKCLSKSKCEVQISAIQGNARPKTAAEKKQGTSFTMNTFSEAPSSDASPGCHSDATSQKNSTPVANKHKTENISNAEKSDNKHSKQSKSSFVKKKSKSPEKNETDSKEKVKDTSESTTISLKAFKRLGQTASDESSIHTVYLNEKRKKNTVDRVDDGVPHLKDPQWKKESRMSSYKIPKISKSTDQRNNTSNAKENKPKEDNMPILEPEVDVDFNASSDRDSSRSPPVITIQDSEDLNVTESKLTDDKIILSSIKVESDTKDIHKKSEMSIAEFITQLAYHEKATIKHRRYCNLCERWFPTTSRHRRHLAGYQHRHIELTQRRSIHALFTLFTGMPCPRLVPANVIRSDCSIGELTPLQIAVQDVTKCFDRTQQSPRKENDVDK